MIVGHGLLLSSAGVAIGVIAAALLTPLLGALLHGVRPADPLTFGAAASALLLVGLLASLVPALRATRVDPVVALRND